MKRFDFYSMLVANGYKLPTADANSYIHARMDIMAFINENDLVNDDERLKVVMYKHSQWRKLIDRLNNNGHKEVVDTVEEKVELDYGIKGHVIPSDLMGYELRMESNYNKGRRYVSFKFSINNYDAVEENKFAPTIGVTYNPLKADSSQEYFVEIQTTSYGALGFDDYEKFMLATQKAFVVAKEFEREIADFVKYQEEYFGVGNGG